MSATDNLVTKIINDATLAAEKVKAEARQEAQRIDEEAQAAISLVRTELQSQIEQDAQETMRRALSQANLVAKKNFLGAKQSLMQEVYSLCATQLCGNDKQYLRLISSQLKLYATKGDVVSICAADKARITQAFLDNVGIGLKLDKQYADISGGVIVRGKQYDVDLSLAVIMRQIREQTEAQVSQILFGANNE